MRQLNDDIINQTTQRFPSVAHFPSESGAPREAVAKTVGSLAESNRMQERLRELIPGGGHTYAKGPDQFPEDRRASSCAGPAATSGMPTATSTSSTAWGSRR